MSERVADLSETLRWAVESAPDAALAAADWLARDIEPRCDTVLELLTSPDVALDRLRDAKDAFKTMRVVGETPADRRLGARLYAATIAAALVHHGATITTQSPAATSRALVGLLDDPAMPESLRTLAGAAVGLLTRSSRGG